MNRIKTLILTTLATMGLLVPMALPVAAQINDSLCEGISFGESADCASATGEAEETVTTLATTIVDLFSLVVGIVSVIMIIVGGFRYITSAGEASNVSGAKNTILYAIVGLVIVAFAQTIVKFVVSKISETA